MGLFCSGRSAAAVIGGLLLSLPPVFAQGLDAGNDAVIRIPATITSMAGYATRMISYRDQNHSWQTTDGAIHLVVNLGPTGLTLYSSFDSGTTWSPMFTLANTDGNSTDDGVLTTTATGASLQLIYATGSGTIAYSTATYDSAAQSWTLASTQTAYSEAGIIATNPAFASDSAGNLWCGFTAENSATQEYQEDMIYQLAGATEWVDTGLIFGQVDNTTQHSARPVAYAGGIGVLYEDEAALYWAYRLNSFALDAPWVSTMMYADLPPESADPYDTHYSVVADSDNNLYLAFIGAPANLIFTIFSSSANTWGPLQLLGKSTAASAYPEISIADGNLLLMANHVTDVEVLQSRNFGKSFRETQVLTHPPVTSGVSYNKPRVETPRYSTSPVPVFQQFVDGSEDELMFFQVPVIN